MNWLLGILSGFLLGVMLTLQGVSNGKVRIYNDAVSCGPRTEATDGSNHDA